MQCNSATHKINALMYSLGCASIQEVRVKVLKNSQGELKAEMNSLFKEYTKEKELLKEQKRIASIEEKKRHEEREKTVGVNIWDDYAEGDMTDLSVDGYGDRSDISDKFRKKLAKMVFTWIKDNVKIEGTTFSMDNEYISISKLSHENRQKLVEQLNTSGLTINGKTFVFYSES